MNKNNTEELDVIELRPNYKRTLCVRSYIIAANRSMMYLFYKDMKISDKEIVNDMRTWSEDKWRDYLSQYKTSDGKSLPRHVQEKNVIGTINTYPVRYNVYTMDSAKRYKRVFPPYGKNGEPDKLVWRDGYLHEKRTAVSLFNKKRR